MSRPKFNQQQIEQSFWNKVNKSAPNGCWEWTGWIQRQPKGSGGGYGKFCVGHDKYYLPHRYSWMISKGPIPEGLLVCHKCDNRKCCNPDHLFLGTHKDNTMDSINKGRWLSGERSPSAKLSDAQVKEIRSRYTRSRGVSALASEFGIDHRYVWAIANKKART